METTSAVETYIHTTDAMDYYDEVMEFANSWWDNHAYSTKLGISFRPAKPFFEEAAKNNALFGIFLREPETKKLIAAYVGVFQHFIYNPSVLMVNEVFWFVVQDHRQKALAAVLLGTVNDQLKQWGIEIMTCSIAHLENEPKEITDKKIASLERIGYNSTDTILYKRV